MVGPVDVTRTKIKERGRGYVWMKEYIAEEVMMMKENSADRRVYVVEKT